MVDDAGLLLSLVTLTVGVLKRTCCVHPHATPWGAGEESNLQPWGLYPYIKTTAPSKRCKWEINEKMIVRIFDILMHPNQISKGCAKNKPKLQRKEIWSLPLILWEKQSSTFDWKWNCFFKLNYESKEAMISMTRNRMPWKHFLNWWRINTSIGKTNPF